MVGESMTGGEGEHVAAAGKSSRNSSRRCSSKRDSSSDSIWSRHPRNAHISRSIRLMLPRLDTPMVIFAQMRLDTVKSLIVFHDSKRAVQKSRCPVELCVAPTIRFKRSNRYIAPKTIQSGVFVRYIMKAMNRARASARRLRSIREAYAEPGMANQDTSDL